MTNVMGVIIKYFRLTKTLTLPFTHTRPSALQNMKTYGQVCYMVTKASFCYSAPTWHKKLAKSTLCHYHSYTEPTGESQRCSVLVKHSAVPFLYHHHSVPDLCSKGNYKELPSFRNRRQEAKPKL